MLPRMRTKIVLQLRFLCLRGTVGRAAPCFLTNPVASFALLRDSKVDLASRKVVNRYFKVTGVGNLLSAEIARNRRIQGNRSYIPLEFDARFQAGERGCAGQQFEMPRLEIVITCLPGPPSCAPRRRVLDDSSHTSCPA